MPNPREFLSDQHRKNALDPLLSAQERASALVRLIDHTLLKADATSAQVETSCEEARQFRFASVCVNSGWVELAARKLAGSAVLPIAVVGFPLGAMETRAKTEETRIAVDLGAREIDMVLNIGLLKSGQEKRVREEIRAVVRQAGEDVPVKVILETALLTDAEKKRACELSVDAGAAYVKTSTGFAAGGATAEDVALMKAAVEGSGVGVKASGGIRTLARVLEMLGAGAMRLGLSASVSIVQELLGPSLNSRDSQEEGPAY